ncbi:hypothetical protein DFH09DRAFT_1099617 [Mycena vulgaris]|nr:hypothetical protein DFH09DRAFT_1099617 [Mycena vulgaris]
MSYAGSMIGGTKLATGAACKFNAFATNHSTNLQRGYRLVVVHAVNGQKMERYYILIGLAISAAWPRHFGGLFWDATSTCWFNSPDRAVQMRWFVSTQAFWMFLMSTCEVTSFFTIVGYMVIGHRVGSGLYPFLSCFFNITELEIRHCWHVYYTAPQYQRVIDGPPDLLTYVLRPMMYALLAATDPCKTEKAWSSTLTSTTGCPLVNSSKVEEETPANANDPDFTCQI